MTALRQSENSRIGISFFAIISDMILSLYKVALAGAAFRS